MWMHLTMWGFHSLHSQNNESQAKYIVASPSSNNTLPIQKPPYSFHHNQPVLSLMTQNRPGRRVNFQLRRPSAGSSVFGGQQRPRRRVLVPAGGRCFTRRVRLRYVGGCRSPGLSWNGAHRQLEATPQRGRFGPPERGAITKNQTMLTFIIFNA